MAELTAWPGLRPRFHGVVAASTGLDPTPQGEDPAGGYPSLFARDAAQQTVSAALWRLLQMALLPPLTVRASPVSRSQRKAFYVMNHTDGWMSGWTGGGMWIGTVIGVLVVVLLVVAITKMSSKKS